MGSIITIKRGKVKKMQEYKPFKEGKVRQVYDIGENLVIYATDRISAFDYILKNTITNKGVVLTKMSKFWFDFTKDIVPNHMISTEVKDCLLYTSTIPLWKSQMVIALGVAHSTEAARAQREVTDMTNALLQKNAESLKMATLEAARESERGIVDIETLKKTNESLISTFDEVMNIRCV